MLRKFFLDEGRYVELMFIKFRCRFSGDAERNVIQKPLADQEGQYNDCPHDQPERNSYGERGERENGHGDS